MKKIVLFLLILLEFFSSSAQTFQANKRDSLRKVLQNEKTDTGKVLLLSSLSELYVESDADTALIVALQALELSRSIRFPKGEAISLIRAGSSYSTSGNYPKAMEAFLQAFMISEKINNKDYMARSLLNIGTQYMYMEDFPRALNYMFRAKAYAEKLKNKKLIVIILPNISTVYNRSQKFDSAKFYAQQAFDLAKEINDPKTIGRTARFLADADRNLGQHSLALEYYHLSIPYLKQTGAQVFLSDVYIHMGWTFDKMKQPDSAFFYTKQGFETAKKSKLTRQLGDASRFLSNYYRSLGKKDSALFYQDITIAANDSLYSHEKQNQITALVAGEQIRQTELAAAADRRKQQRTFFIIGGGFLLLVVLLAFQLRVSSIRKKEKEKTAQIKKEAELELQSLRAQLNPHFMFNSLNAIQELILKEDFENSHTYLARFAKLLRLLLENAEQPFVSLKREIVFLELYLSLEKLRIPDLRFSISTDPSINKEETFVPNMILQPHIENALWHGLSPKPGDKLLFLNIYKQNGAVVYDVCDNGIGRKKAAELKGLYRKEHKSKGMELLTKRFRLLSEEFGTDIKTEVRDLLNNGEADGTMVSITVPDSIKTKNLLS